MAITPDRAREIEADLLGLESQMNDILGEKKKAQEGLSFAQQEMASHKELISQYEDPSFNWDSEFSRKYGKKDDLGDEFISSLISRGESEIKRNQSRHMELEDMLLQKMAKKRFLQVMMSDLMHEMSPPEHFEGIDIYAALSPNQGGPTPYEKMLFDLLRSLARERGIHSWL